MPFRVLVLAAVVTLPARLADAQPGFTVSSPMLTSGGTMPQAQVLDGFGCHGGNRSPALIWTAPPPGTRSLAITMYDPDAPGGGWWHWTVFNLAPSVRAVAEAPGEAGNAPLPDGGIEGRTDFGTSGYGGPCPPSGDRPHHYVITIWALNVDRLPLDQTSPGALVGRLLRQHVIGKAMLTVLYQR